MQLRFSELTAHLGSGLAPVYLILGDEPWQLKEAQRLIREAAQRAGFSERVTLETTEPFSWGELQAAAQNLSLFAARRFIELRLTSGRLDAAGEAAIGAYCEQPSPDSLLLILAPGLDRKSLQAGWVRRLDARGVIIQVWPLKGPELERWVQQRLIAAGFRPEPGVVGLLVERCEGNLLAADQEIEKLRLLKDPGPLGLDELLGSLADSARFDPFALTEAALLGDRARIHRILEHLRAEGVAEAVVLWALAREPRLLIAALQAQAQRLPLQGVWEAHRVPRMRQGLIENALKRLQLASVYRLLRQCAIVDRMIKGAASGDPWQRLAMIADGLGGGPVWEVEDLSSIQH